MTVHLDIGVRMDGICGVPSMGIAENEGTGFQVSVFNGLKHRSVESIFIATTDGYKCMTGDLESVYL